jgi:choline dehydrogenase
MGPFTRLALAAALSSTLVVADWRSYTQHVIDGNTKSAKSAKYDYVVVGGGTGGLAMAHRLAESGQYTVAVIEAGGFADETGNFSAIPAYAEAAFTNISPDAVNDFPENSMTWPFVTTPQAYAGGARFRYARGKALGGT